MHFSVSTKDNDAFIKFLFIRISRTLTTVMCRHDLTVMPTTVLLYYYLYYTN